MTAIINKLSAPHPSNFPPDEDFIDAPDLEGRAALIMGREQAKFGDLEDQSLAFLWKKKGGSARGQTRLGQAKRVTGDLKFYSGKSAIVWLAADHHEGLSDRRIEATLYHELCHLMVDEEGKLKLLGHDFEGFGSEVEKYGDILTDAQEIAGAFFEGFGSEVEKYGDILTDAQEIAGAFKQLILFGGEQA